MEQKPVKIFSTRNVPRLNYIADLILREILGVSWELITDKRRLGKSPVINYSGEVIPGSLKIAPAPLLYETGVTDREISVGEWKGLPVFFMTGPDSDLPFDIFAASFYLVSRYEEYLQFEPDEHGRFRSSSSLAFRHGFLGIPVVDLWSKELARLLVRKFHRLAFKPNEYHAVTTIDIDEPFSTAHGSLLGNIGGFFHDITSKAVDPGTTSTPGRSGEKSYHEVFDYLTNCLKKYSESAGFFFLLGKRSKYEKNPSWKNREYQGLINRISENFSAGIHPSFRASTDAELILNEIGRLKVILKKDVLKSRFHFLRISMPLSYRNLAKAGIQEDYSMGFPDEPGFRAGIARSFKFYDVIDENSTNLRIFPFMVMDVTLTDYKKLDTEKAREVINDLIVKTKQAGGVFISIWHNTTLLDTPERRNWREVFEFALDAQIN